MVGYFNLHFILLAVPRLYLSEGYGEPETYKKLKIKLSGDVHEDPGPAQVLEYILA